MMGLQMRGVIGAAEAGPGASGGRDEAGGWVGGDAAVTKDRREESPDG